MKISPTGFEGLLIIEPPVFEDERGYFTEAYNYQEYADAGLDIKFVQDNQSFSRKGVIRGLHFQDQPKAQTKLVRVLNGVILDIVVDLRRFQPTYKKIHAIELSREGGKQLLVPKGFAHGFSVLSDSADVIYKSDVGYAPEYQNGIYYDDPELKIDWLVEPEKRIISAKDKLLPLLKDARVDFH